MEDPDLPALDRNVFSSCMDVLMGVFRCPLAVTALNGYYEVLKGLTGSEMEAVTQVALDRCERMPPPARLLGYIRGYPDHMAERQWFSFLDLFRRHGASCSMACEDPRTAMALRSLGGLTGLGRRNAQDFNQWGKRDFISAWKAAYDDLQTGKRSLGSGGQVLLGTLGHQSRTVGLPAAKEPPAKELASRTNRSYLPGRSKPVLVTM